MYDIIIIGGGPSGMSSAIFGKRAGLSVLILEKTVTGGQMSTAPEVANYPGFENISGLELAQKMEKHAINLGAEIKYETVKSIDISGVVKKVECRKNTYEGKTLIISTGTHRRQLGLEKEAEFLGSGVSYCATCDAAFFKGLPVAIVGGGNAALKDADHLSRTCEKVYLIHSRDSFKAPKVLQDSVIANPKIEILYNSRVTEIKGEFNVSGLTIKNNVTGDESELAVKGLFIVIGTEPANELVQGMLKLDEQGYIIAGEDCCTSVSGVYAIGDIRKKPMKQIVTAVADGAVASQSAKSYIMKNKSVPEFRG